MAEEKLFNINAETIQPAIQMVHLAIGAHLRTYPGDTASIRGALMYWLAALHHQEDKQCQHQECIFGTTGMIGWMLKLAKCKQPNNPQTKWISDEPVTILSPQPATV